MGTYQNKYVPLFFTHILTQIVSCVVYNICAQWYVHTTFFFMFVDHPNTHTSSFYGRLLVRFTPCRSKLQQYVEQFPHPWGFCLALTNPTNQHLTAFSALTLFAGHHEEHPACKKLRDEVLAWWQVAGMVICLEVHDLHMVQLMPLPPYHLLLH